MGWGFYGLFLDFLGYEGDPGHELELWVRGEAWKGFKAWQGFAEGVFIFDEARVVLCASTWEADRVSAKVELWGISTCVSNRTT